MTRLFPEENGSFLFPGGAGDLELSTTWPADNSRNKVIVICHPHPLQGGSMENKVVTTMMRAFNELGFKTVRFNFRGVGCSAGVHDQGQGEAEDLMAILDWLMQVLPEHELWLAGFSFGAFIAYKVAVDARYQTKIKKLISIAPPVQYPEFASLPKPTIPWLVVQGEADDIVNAQAVADFMETCDASARTLVELPDTGHFFHGRLLDLKNILKEECA